MMEMERGKAGGATSRKCEGLLHEALSQLGIASSSSSDAFCSRSFSNTGLYFTIAIRVQAFRRLRALRSDGN